jgi:nitroimidazol reductase NimA-like FMN-containing flavoprotein (pyridoxamine 5'-phosphate oxidase superfamily)
MSQYARTPRTTLKRRAQRGSYERAAVHAILDEAFLCHVAFDCEGQPACIPMVYARVGDALYLHGSPANRALRALAGGAPACVTVTLVDALVLARSAFHCSANYRSLVAYGSAREVADPARKLAALRAIVEHAIPKCWADLRAPSETELRQTLVVEFPLAEVSAKIRSGPPIDDAEDYAREGWAGIIPLALRAGPPVADPLLPPGRPAPSYASAYTRPSARE